MTYVYVHVCMCTCVCIFANMATHGHMFVYKSVNENKDVPIAVGKPINGMGTTKLVASSC